MALLCIAGPQAAAILALLLVAWRRPMTVAGRYDDTWVEVGPNGQFRLYRGTAPRPDEQDGLLRCLQACWQGPFWITLTLRDPYFPQTAPDILTIWSFGQAPEAWRRFRVLVASVQWVGHSGTAGRVAI